MRADLALVESHLVVLDQCMEEYMRDLRIVCPLDKLALLGFTFGDEIGEIGVVLIIRNLRFDLVHRAVIVIHGCCALGRCQHRRVRATALRFRSFPFLRGSRDGLSLFCSDHFRQCFLARRIFCTV